jgi:hypothetical protein
MQEESLKWNGSDLGIYDITVISAWIRVEEKDMDFINLRLPFGRVMANIVKYKNYIPIFVDELKKIFNLIHSGTHIITLPTIKNTKKYQKYILIRVEHIDNLVRIPKTLDEYELFFSKKGTLIHKDSFKKKMEYLIIFYYIIGVPYNEKRIHIRETDYGPYPHPYYETTISENRIMTSLSSTNIRKWFNDENDLPYIGKRLVTLLNVNETNIFAVITKFQEDYEELINRINPDLLLTYWYIVDYVNNLLSEEFNDINNTVSYEEIAKYSNMNTEKKSIKDFFKD